MKRELIETPEFTRRIRQGWLSDDELLALQIGIMKGRGRIDQVPGFADLQKLRLSNPRRQRGTRGGYRVYFVDYADLAVVVLLLITDKELQRDLNEAQRKMLRGSLAGLRKEMEDHVAKSKRRRRF